MHAVVGFAVCIILAGCATQTASNSDPLAGTWVFDAEATRKSIQSSTGWSDEWMEPVMRAYSPATFTFAKGRYEMKVKRKVIKGTYSLKRLSPTAYRMVMTCPIEPDGDSGKLEFFNNSFSFESDTPLVKGAKEVFRRKD